MRRRFFITVLLVAGIITIAVFVKNSENGAELTEFNSTESTEVTAEDDSQIYPCESPLTSAPVADSPRDDNYYNDNYQSNTYEEYEWYDAEPTTEDFAPPSPPNEYPDPEPDWSSAQDTDVFLDEPQSAEPETEQTTTTQPTEATTEAATEATTEATTEADYDFMGVSDDTNSTTATEATPEPKPEESTGLEQPSDASVWESAPPKKTTEAPTTEAPATEETANDSDWLGGTNHESNTQESTEEDLDWLGGANHDPNTALTGDPDPSIIE